ncbi:hypothetical protein LOK49_LG07G01755 [Camellia lanceoleosa]|uniref:Uncharacterized protein n=1 Tax=Camellia lanceoleosa TaxID=1840588 RepID=A0ACC0H8S0_9ERIC|nr:hypothetical protein LOK49_LG07G01755 [Camellia lanceoleosa]
MAVVQHLLRKIENFIKEHPSKNELVTHKHRLTDLPEKDGNEEGDGGGRIKCDACQRLISEGPARFCRQCKYFIHKSCQLESPLKIYFRFHNRHPLTLHHFKPIPPTKKSRKEKLADYDSASASCEEELTCSACELPFIGTTPTYACTECPFYIHKFCAEIPRKIKHPLHPAHSLRLTTKTPSHISAPRFWRFNCNVCKRTSRGFAFVCQECDFYVDLHCMFLNPTIDNQEAHEHPLTVLHEQSTDSLHVCLKCSKKFSGPPVLYCVTCNDNFHIQCLLPSKIKSTCHRHPLALVNSLEKDNGSDDEYYCDACEKERIPKQPVYHCMERCSYNAAYVDCAYSKVENVIRRSEEVVTLEDLFKSLTLEDEKVVKDIILAAKGKQIVQDRKLREKKIDTNEAFEEFMKRFDSTSNHHRPDFKLYHCRFSSKVVKTGDFLIPKKLAPVFQNLLDKYGEFRTESTMSLKVKNCIYIALCDVAYHMCTTSLKDLHGHEVFNGQDWFLYAQNAGLKVKSAIDDFKKIVEAYYSLHLRVEELDQKIGRLRARIDSLVENRDQLLKSPVTSLEDEFGN